MSMSEELRKQMLREVLAFNIIPIARPGDISAYDVVRAAKEEGRPLSRCQAYRWLDKMVVTAGWEKELVMINGHRTMVWRKPESSKD